MELDRVVVFVAVVTCVLPALSHAQAVGAPAPAVPATEQALTPAQAALQARQDALQSAIVKGDAKAVRAFIRSGMKLDFNFNDLLPRGRSFESPLTMAIYRGQLEIARLLLEGGADVRRKDGFGMSAIHQARSAEAVKLLAAAGADLDVPDERGRTAAVAAVERGDLAVLDILLANGARLNATSGGQDLFVRVIESRHPELIGPLLERGANPRSPPTQALWPLIESGDTERARLLLRAGADPNARKGRESLLARALFRSRWEITEALLDAGAGVRVSDPSSCGESFMDCPAIQYARLASVNPAVLARLQAKGLDLDAVAKDGHTALTSLVVERPLAVRGVGATVAAIPAPDNVARAKALLERGADPNRKYRGMTPLMLAIASPGTAREMADMMIPFGARIEHETTIRKPDRDTPAPAGRGTTPVENNQGLLTGMLVGPLTWAAIYSRPDIALRLAQRDGTVTRADRDLLYFAAVLGHWELAKGALQYTQRVNVADRADVTPLMLASHAGRADVVRAFLAAGAKVNSRSARDWPPLLETDFLAALSGHPSRPPLVGGYTALRAARERGHQEVARILEEAGGKE